MSEFCCCCGNRGLPVVGGMEEFACEFVFVDVV